MKQCKTCKTDKELDQFSNSKRNAGGKLPNCKLCCKLKVNKEATNAASKRYRDNNPSKRYERDKKYRKENVDKVKIKRRLYLNERYKTDPTYRIQAILRQQVVDYIKYKKSERTSQLLGYTAEDFINIYGIGGSHEQLDHRIPQSWFKLNTPVHIVWDLNNLQWIDTEENQIKGNRFAHPVSEKYLQIVMPYILESYLPYLTT